LLLRVIEVSPVGARPYTAVDQGPKEMREPSHTQNKASRSFEQQVHRIHELLSDTDAIVTWNDRILDPDSEGRGRQIDVTVRRGEHLTLIECRSHKAPQDVTWIEELIGRRISLRANAVIAVSASGFSAGAIAKGNTHNIALRDLRELSDTEIANWGRSITLTIHFFQYRNLTLALGFSPTDTKAITRECLTSSLPGHPALVTIFNKAARVLGLRLTPAVESQNLSFDFAVSGAFDNVSLCEKRLVQARLHGSAGLLSQQVKCPVVSAYGDPSTSAANREVAVQSFDLGDTSIVHKGKRVSMHLDLSLVKTPPLCQFRYVSTKGDDEVDVEVFSLAGLEHLNVREGTIALEVYGISESFR
jgi:hypothetical protein